MSILSKVSIGKNSWQFFPFGNNLDSIQTIRSSEKQFHLISNAASTPLRSLGVLERIPVVCVLLQGPQRHTRICPHTCKQFRVPSWLTCTPLDYWRKLDPQQGTQTDTHHWGDKQTQTPLRKSSEPTALLLLCDSVNFCITKDVSFYHKTSLHNCLRLKTLHSSQDLSKQNDSTEPPNVVVFITEGFKSLIMVHTKRTN